MFNPTRTYGLITRAIALQRFALRVLGRCKPRIRRRPAPAHLPDDSSRNYGPLAPLVARADRNIDTELIAEQFGERAY
jgi:hypothetical protein